MEVYELDSSYGMYVADTLNVSVFKRVFGLKMNNLCDVDFS